MTARALETAFPALTDSLPRIALTDLPTPVAPLPTLASELGLDRLQIKRDDQTGRVYGGNKVRKLEYLLGDALHRGCDSVLTFGAVGSNHALATAIYASQLNLGCHVIMSAQPATPGIAQTLRYHARLGTHLELAADPALMVSVADRLTEQHVTGATRLYRIPAGGSSSRGAIGFAAAGLELAAQYAGDAADAIPDVIYVACGTMGTVAGLALGLRLAGLHTRIEAVRVVPSVVTTLRGIEKLFVTANHELHKFDESVPLIRNPLINITLRDEFFGPGYAEPTPECMEAVALIRDTENVILETTYTGKALAALIHDARSRKLEGRHILFWNTYNARTYPAQVNDSLDSSLPGWAHPYLDSSEYL